MEKSSSMYYGASPILFKFAKELRLNPTEAESHLWDFICNRQLDGYRFKRQHPILFFIADFYCHTSRLVIEIDGGYHNIPEQYLYDKKRDSELLELGIKVIRFTNEDILLNIEESLKQIREHLSVSPL